MTVTYVLFDLDNTLYPSDGGLLKEIDSRMTAFVVEYLGISAEKAKALRVGFRDRYGTTLRGLMEEYDFKEYDRFFREVHPEDPSIYLDKDPVLKTMLASIKLPKSVLTNSPVEHAERVLEYLEIRDFFQHIFDIRFNRLVGKPNISAYRRVLEYLGIKPEETVFIDDLKIYLEPFKEMGGKAILIEHGSRKEEKSNNGIIRVQSLQELPAIIENL